MSSKNRFRSKRKGKSPSYNANNQGVIATLLTVTLYTVTEDRETLMGILGNLSVRPRTATGAAFFMIHLTRAGGAVFDPQIDSVGYQKYRRLWDYVVSFDAGASETQLVDIVSKKRRKLWVGDVIQITHVSNVIDVCTFSIQIRGIQLLIG